MMSAAASLLHKHGVKVMSEWLFCILYTKRTTEHTKKHEKYNRSTIL